MGMIGLPGILPGSLKSGQPTWQLQVLSYPTTGQETIVLVSAQHYIVHTSGKASDRGMGVVVVSQLNS